MIGGAPPQGRLRHAHHSNRTTGSKRAALTLLCVYLLPALLCVAARAARWWPVSPGAHLCPPTQPKCVSGDGSRRCSAPDSVHLRTKPGHPRVAARTSSVPLGTAGDPACTQDETNRSQRGAV